MPNGTERVFGAWQIHPSGADLFKPTMANYWALSMKARGVCRVLQVKNLCRL